MYKLIFSLILGYLFGSLSFAVIISRIKGINIREVGTGNPGAANVYREVGKPYGIAVWILDTLKGVVPMIISYQFLHLPFLVVSATGALAIAGHCWSIFLRFKGGKGVATMGGVTLYLFPIIFPIGALLYFWVQKSGRKPIIIYIAFLIFFSALFIFYHTNFLSPFISYYFLPHKKWLEIILSLIILFSIAFSANIATIREVKMTWAKKR